MRPSQTSVLWAQDQQSPRSRRALLTPPQEPLPPAAAVSRTYTAQWQPLPVTLGKMQEEVERPLGMTHKGIHNLFQQKSRHREFVSKPTTTII